MGKLVAIGGGKNGRIKQDGTKDPYETKSIDEEIVRLTGKESESTYGNDFDYQQAMNEVLLSMNFCEMFGLNRREVYANQSKILSFGSARFKKDLKAVIDKVLMKRMTLFELNSVNLDGEEGPKKVLKP